jgi:CspA family cold shock protein
VGVLPTDCPRDFPGGSERRAPGMPTGTIARLLIDKGFGFIRDEGGTEHFFHRSSVRGAVFELLREGQRVEFTPEDSGKGPRAGDVRLIED